VTGTLPQEVRDVFSKFITTEFVTVDAKGQPIAWPLTPYYTDAGPVIEVTTGIGYPKKAEDARRNPRVAMLFSDPTGSGIESGIQVLVQGAAEIDDADLSANRERYRRESALKLPATQEMMPPKLVEGLFSWYYERLYIRVRPERIFVWADGDRTSEPQLFDSRIEEVRSGHAEEPQQPPAPTPAGDPLWDDRIDELGGRHPTAALAWIAPDGFPLALRVSVSPDRERRRISISDVPAGLPLTPGRACLAAHSHPPDFKWQENFQVRGELSDAGDGWALGPRKLIGGFELPKESELARYRRNLGKSVKFYKTRKRLLKERGARG
jgi:hypothetical protein